MIPAPDIIAAALSGYSITTGDLLNDNYVRLALTCDERLRTDPEDRHGYIALLSDGQASFIESFPITSQTALPGAGELISISAAGSVRRSSPAPRGSNDEARVGDASGQPVHGRTRLTSVAGVDDVAYAVGTRRSVYRRQAADVWEPIDQGCYEADNFEVGFNDLDGFAPDDLYAVGELGEIWHFDGRAWKAIASPTDQALNTVTCASDGIVYAAGAKGVIIAGRGVRWRVIEEVPTGLEFWGSAWHEGALHLTANLRSVHRLDTVAGLHLVDFGGCPVPASAYHLKVRAGALWLFGPKHIRRHAEGAWTEIATLG